MKTIIAIVFVMTGTASLAETPSIADKFRVAAIYCTLTGEQTSGVNKICFYNCAGSEAAITVKSYEVCRAGINR